MSDSAAEAPVSPGRYLWLGPALALGLFSSRLLSELLQPGLIAILALTLTAIGVTALLLRRAPIRQMWPLLILLIYVLYPEADFRVAVAIGLATAIALLQTVESPFRQQILSRRTADVLAAAAIILVFFVLYVSTLAGDVLPADAGELQLVAAKWGVAHPTGFPLYTILANLVTRLPVGLNPAYRANLLSAFTSALTVLLVYMIVYRLSGRRGAGWLAAIALGTSATFWSQATMANVRSMTALFTAAALYLLLVLQERQPSATAADDDELRNHGRRRLWQQALFVFVIVSAVVHHASLVFIAGLFTLYVLIVQRAFIKERGRWPVLSLAGFIALLPLLYLPIRGAAGAVGASDDLATLNGFINHALGLGFRGDLFFFDQISVLWARLMVMVNVLTFQFPPFVLLVALLGLIFLFATDRLLATVLATSMVIHTVVAAVYRAPQTVEYMLPVYVLISVSIGYAVGRLRDYQKRSRKGRLGDYAISVASVLTISGLVVIVFSQMMQTYTSYRVLSEDASTREYAQHLMRDAPPNAVVLADWHWATPLWYLQEVEGTRPDLDVQFVFPESGLYSNTWAGRIAGELEAGRQVIATHYDPAAYNDLPLAEPFHDAYIFRQEPLLELPDRFETLQAELGPGIFAEGFRLLSREVQPGQEMVLDLAWRAGEQVESGRNLYAHLIGADGRLYAGDDQLALANSEGLTITQFRLTPLLQAPLGTYELVVGSYGDPAAGAADAFALAEVQVRSANLPPFTRNRTFRQLSGASDGRALIGYDWDSTLPGRQRLYLHWSTDEGYETEVKDVDGDKYILPSWHGPWGVEIGQSSFELDRPGAYMPFGQGIVWLGQSRNEQEPFAPGHRARLNQEFAAGRPVLSDQVVSLRLVAYGEDGRSWDWWDLDDGVPALGAIPTLKWIIGSRVDHPVYPTISVRAKPNQETEPLLLLYDAFTSRRLPILDERITETGPWVPLGRVSVASEP